MTNDYQALAYGLMAGISTSLGGLVPILKKKVSDAYLSLLMAVSAGIVLATAFHELFVEGLRLTELAPVAVGVGFFIMYIFERIMIVHACPESHMECEIHTLGWSAFVGLSIHSLIDGIAIAAGFEVSVSAGIIVTAAVLIHEFPEGFATSSILLAGGHSRVKAYLGSVTVGFLTPLGVLIGVFVLGISEIVLGISLAFSAGTFIYIATSDLLPEAHHRYRSLWLIPAVVGGYAGVLLFELLLH